MKWYSSLEYRPEADADIWVRSGESPGPDGTTQAVSELISARLGFYDKLDEYCGLEIIWQYANGYKDREPIKWDEFEAMLPLPLANFEAKLLNVPSGFDSSILPKRTKTYKSSNPLIFKRYHEVIKPENEFKEREPIKIEPPEVLPSDLQVKLDQQFLGTRYVNLGKDGVTIEEDNGTKE